MSVDTRPMWDGQAEAVEFSVRRKKSIWDIDPGLGKTRGALEVRNRLLGGTSHTTLVCGGKPTVPPWRLQPQRWCEDISESDYIRIEGGSGNGPLQRKKFWKRAAKKKLIHTNYTILKNDWEDIPHDVIKMFVWDECDEIRRHKAPSLEPIKKICWRVPIVILMTGTLIEKGPQDLYTYLNLVDPETFKSYWKWVGSTCEQIQGPFGREIIGPKNVENTRRVLKDYLFRLKEDDPRVRAARPSLVRDLVPMHMSRRQRAMYEELSSQLLLELSTGEYEISPIQAAVYAKLRRLLISPRLIDPAEELGPSFDYLEDQLEKDRHFVVFTPFRNAVDLICVWLASKGLQPVPFMGGMTGDEIVERQEYFNATPHEGKIAVGTTVFGRGYELPTARQVHHLGFSYVSKHNYQADKRLQRLTTKHNLMSWYLCYEDTVDKDIFDKLNDNVRNAKVTFKDYQNLIRMRKAQNPVPTV